MTKKTIIIISLFLYTIASIAQVDKSGKMEFGVKGGATLSTASTHYKNNKYNFGYNAGLSFSYYMDENYTLNTGLEYISKGVTGKHPYAYPTTSNGVEVMPEGDVKTKIEIGYLQIPVTVGSEFVQSGKFSMDVRAGMYIAMGINLKVKEDINANIIQTNSDGSSVVAETINSTIKHSDWDWMNMRRLDWGATAGLGIKYDSFFLYCNYDLGLLNIGDARINDGRLKYRFKNRNFALSVGYNFISK